MNSETGANRIRAYLRAQSLEEYRELVHLPFRDACAQLSEVLRSPLPEDVRVGMRQQEDDSLMFRISCDGVDLDFTVGISYLASNACHLIYQFLRDLNEEPTDGERVLMGRDPEYRAQIEAHYAGRREKQAQGRRVRKAVMESIAARWNALQKQVKAGATAEQLEASSAKPRKSLGLKLRRYALVLRAIPYIAQGEGLGRIAEILETDQKTLEKGMEEFGEEALTKAIAEHVQKERERAPRI